MDQESSTVGKKRRKLIAALRNITPSEVNGVCDILVEGGFSMIELTTNSPDYLESLSQIVKRYPASVMIGVGTVITEEQVRRIHGLGATFIVSPNTDPLIIAETKSLGLHSIPGVFTPTEAITALDAGADCLKLFPASWAHPSAARDLKAVLPPSTVIYAMGGVKPEQFSAYRKGGFDGFGMGNSLFHPGISLNDLKENCKNTVKAYDEMEKGD